MAARSPASSCVALMASRRLILRAKKMKCFKDDLKRQPWTRDLDITPECRTFRSLLKKEIVLAGMRKQLAHFVT